MNLPVTDVPRCSSSNAKTLGLKHLQLPNVASYSEPPDGTSIIHHGMDELPIEQNTFTFRNAIPPVEDTNQHPQPLEGSFPNLVVMR